MVIGYTIVSPPELAIEQEKKLDAGGEGMDIDGTGENGEENVYRGKVIYLLPGGLISSEFMVNMGTASGRKIREEDVEIEGGRGVLVFE